MLEPRRTWHLFLLPLDSTRCMAYCFTTKMGSLNLPSYPFIIIYTGPLKGLSAKATHKQVFICSICLIFYTYLLYLLVFKTHVVICSLLEGMANVIASVKNVVADTMKHICQNTTDWRLVPHAELVNVSSGFSW